MTKVKLKDMSKASQKRQRDSLAVTALENATVAALQVNTFIYAFWRPSKEILVRFFFPFENRERCVSLMGGKVDIWSENPYSFKTPWLIGLCGRL